MAEQNFERIPPQNIEAEQSVLAALMMDKNAIYKVSDILQPGDFYREAHNIIYKTMLDLIEKGQPTDVLSLTNRLEETKKLEKIGGSSYLATLANAVSAASNIVHYAKIVHHKKILRSLIDAANHINELGYNETENLEQLLDEAEQRIFGITQRSLTQDFSSVKSHLEGAFERLEKLHEGQGDIRGLPTGYGDLDNLIGGLHKADLVILAARPSLGK
ncbi:MAG: replicative DNA helicase, partial [Candidatus Portnoybacteria bacterium CG10_big_fil_rev_8_21_14_0_10_44_7]